MVAVLFQPYLFLDWSNNSVDLSLRPSFCFTNSSVQNMPREETGISLVLLRHALTALLDATENTENIFDDLDFFSVALH